MKPTEKAKPIQEFKCGVKHGIPIALGYFAVSFTFGIATARYGMNAFTAGLLYLLNVTSAGQFAGLEVIAAAGSYFELIMTQVIINLRYSLMSFALSQKIDKNTKDIHRLAMAYGVTDEIFGISASRPGTLSPYYNYGAIAVAVPGWTLGTIAGTVSGTLLPQMLLTALAVAIYGMFIAIIIPPARDDKYVLYSILIAMAISSIFKYVPMLSDKGIVIISNIAKMTGKITSGFVIIIATVVAAGIMSVIRPVEDEKS